jgi:hypothetical protein
MKKEMLDFLLENANPSIVLRVKKEILNNLSGKEEKELSDKITLEKNVQTVIQSQKPDGWFGNAFHGQSPKSGAGMYDNMEVGLRYLAEKGFPPENEYISKAVNSFLLKEPFDPVAYRIKRETPAEDYAYTASGLYLARSSIIIRAGYEHRLLKNNFIDLKHDIDYSLKTFLNVLNYNNADDAIDTHRKKLCFKTGIMWPRRKDQNMLAHIQGKKKKKNISLLADSVTRLFTFPPFGEMVYTYKKGQFMGPCMAFIHTPILRSTEDATVGSDWFDIMELFARCGIVKRVEVLNSEYKNILALIDENLNININFSKHKNENSWSPYFGIALEEDWKTKIRLQCDLLFRVLLIIHHAEN